MKFILSVLLVLIVLLPKTSAQDKYPKEFESFAIKCNKLFEERKYTEYLSIIDTVLGRFPQYRQDILHGKLKALDSLGRNLEAAKVAEEIDLLEGGVKFNNTYEIAWRYSISNDAENAFIWAKKSADRGFQNFHYYSMFDDFKPLQRHPKFNEIISQLKENAGMNKPVKQFQLKDLNGNEISPEKFIGKIVLIDFWATWCPPCVAEIPNLVKLYSDLKGKNFEIIGISLDTDKEKLEKFITERKIKWPVVFCGKENITSMRDLYGVKLVPATWLVDKKGIVRNSQIKGERLKNAIIELIRE